MSSKLVKQLHHESTKVIDNGSFDHGQNSVTFDMDKVKEYFVNVTRVMQLAKHITDNVDISAEREELAELTRQFNEQNEQIKSSQELTRGYLKTIVEFNAKAEALIEKLSEHDKQLEMNQKLEAELNALRQKVDQSGNVDLQSALLVTVFQAYPTETELQAEKQAAASLTTQIDAARAKLAELQKRESTSVATSDPILSLFS